MGKIFPMAPLKVRQGFVRKREKEARRAVETRARASVKTAGARVLAQCFPAVADKPTPTRLEQYSRRRRRTAKQKAEAYRLKQDIAISTGAKEPAEGHPSRASRLQAQLPER